MLHDGPQKNGWRRRSRLNEHENGMTVSLQLVFVYSHLILSYIICKFVQPSSLFFQKEARTNGRRSKKRRAPRSAGQRFCFFEEFRKKIEEIKNNKKYIYNMYSFLLFWWFLIHFLFVSTSRNWIYEFHFRLSQSRSSSRPWKRWARRWKIHRQTRCFDPMHWLALISIDWSSFSMLIRNLSDLTWFDHVWPYWHGSFMFFPWCDDSN